MLFVTTTIFASAASGATHTATSLFTLKKCLRAQKRIGERVALGAQSAQKLAERNTSIIVGGDRDKANDRIGARRQFRLQTLSDVDAAIVSTHKIGGDLRYRSLRAAHEGRKRQIAHFLAESIWKFEAARARSAAATTMRSVA